MSRVRGVLAALALTALLAGCSAPEAAPVTPAPPAAAPAPASVAPGASPAEAACAANARTADTIRKIASAMEQGPVLPAGVALFLLDARARAAAPGVEDPRLAAAQAEVVAAIDDLDAQGRALLPPGGNPAQDKVQLDPARVVAAVEAVERICAA